VLTDGAFDITYASVGYLYDFRKRVRPDEAQIDKALPAVNYRHVLLDPKNQTVQFSQKRVYASISAASPRAIRWTAASMC
jgi:thiamine biosynthesis lipoprotein